MLLKEEIEQEALLEMEKYNYNVEQMDQGTVTLVVGSCQGFCEGAVEKLWRRGDALLFPATHFASLVWVFPAPAKGAL